MGPMLLSSLGKHCCTRLVRTYFNVSAHLRPDLISLLLTFSTPLGLGVNQDVAVVDQLFSVYKKFIETE